MIGGQRPEGIDNGEYGWSQIGVHDLVPKTGYREYWYPAIEANKVGRKKYGLFGARGGKRVKLLGEDVVIFKGKDGKFGAVWNRCPHRGALLSFGRCEFEGTISCPYHGYTFDETGLCVGALTEGPESGLNGKLRVKSYPTKVVNGIVFVWMGQTQPVPIEEDMPKEFFDKNFIVHTYSKVWPINWSITIENSGDSHNSYIHRFRMRRLLNMEAFRQLPAYWSGTRVVGETENSMGIAPTVHAPQQAYFPLMDATWPQARVVPPSKGMAPWGQDVHRQALHQRVPPAQPYAGGHPQPGALPLGGAHGRELQHDVHLRHYERTHLVGPVLLPDILPDHVALLPDQGHQRTGRPAGAAFRPAGPVGPPEAGNE